MNPQIKRRWVEALRSDNYRQGTRKLNANGKFCCLGVLCEIAVEDGVLRKAIGADFTTYYTKSGKGYDSLIGFEISEWAGMPYNNPSVIPDDGTQESLTSLNDSGRADFNRIADLIEEQL